MGVKPSSRWKGMFEPSKFNIQLNHIKEKKENNHEEIINLTEGDPVIFGHVNQNLSKYLVEAVNSGLHMYPDQTQLRKELVQSIHNFEKKYRNIEYNLDNIIIGPGVAGRFKTLHYSLLEQSDEMVIIEPAHYLLGPTSYWHYFESKVITSPSSEESAWEPDIDILRKKNY